MLKQIKNQLEKTISNIAEYNDMTDLQVYACCFAIGVITVLFFSWIF